MKSCTRGWTAMVGVIGALLTGICTAGGLYGNNTAGEARPSSPTA